MSETLDQQLIVVNHWLIMVNPPKMGLSWLNDGQSWSIMVNNGLYIYIELLAGGDWEPWNLE